MVRNRKAAQRVTIPFFNRLKANKPAPIDAAEASLFSQRLTTPPSRGKCRPQNQCKCTNPTTYNRDRTGRHTVWAPNAGRRAAPAASLGRRHLLSSLMLHPCAQNTPHAQKTLPPKSPKHKSLPPNPGCGAANQKALPPPLHRKNQNLSPPLSFSAAAASLPLLPLATFPHPRPASLGPPSTHRRRSLAAPRHHQTAMPTPPPTHAPPHAKPQPATTIQT